MEDTKGGQFIKILNIMCDGKYQFLRVKSVDVDMSAMTISVQLSVPYDKFNLITEEDKKSILACAVDILPEDFQVNISYRKFSADEDIIMKLIKEYIAKFYRSFVGILSQDNITVSLDSESVSVTLEVTETIENLLEKSGFTSGLKNYLDSCYNLENTIKIKRAQKLVMSSTAKEDMPVLIDDCYIATSAHHKLCGGDISSKPRYISSFNSPQNAVCVAGKVDSIVARNAKSSGNLYYNFTVNDTTGSMHCCYFTRKAANGPLDIVEEGAEIIIVGDLQTDSYRGGLSLRAKSVSFCKIDYDSILSPDQLTQYKPYTPVTEKPLTVTAQQNIFDMGKPIPDYLMSRDFVVFDLETTGLLDDVCKIIELGAVKIENGVCTEYFNTLVDPKMPIPEGASAVNNIYDDMVADAPYIENVLPDFFKWAGNSTLVAHNGNNFDFIVLKNVAEENSLPFNYETKDTIVLSQIYRTRFNKKGQLNLKAMCKEFDIELTEAHRAYFDAYATAQLFIKLCDFIDVENTKA